MIYYQILLPAIISKYSYILENLFNIKTNLNLTEQFEKLIQDKDLKTQSDNRLIEANELYNKWVKDGVIKPRGYTLRGIEDIHLLQVRLEQ